MNRYITLHYCVNKGDRVVPFVRMLEMEGDKLIASHDLTYIEAEALGAVDCVNPNGTISLPILKPDDKK